MVSTSAIALDRAPVEIDGAELAGFAAGLRGDLILPADPSYDEVRQVWNGMIDRYPALVVRCRGTADIAAAVTFAPKHGLRTTVRAGGHQTAGSAVCDDGLMIDLSLMRGVYVDPVNRTARVEPGVTWADLDHETQLFGLMTPGGEVSNTGVAGLTLSGGYASTRRKFGLSCDNLRSVQIVTADGRVRTASESDHPDLFWAVRGGGGNFGIVSSFEFQLHPLGPEVYRALFFFAANDAPGILRHLRDIAPQLPEELSVTAGLTSTPPLPDFPEAMHGLPVLLLSSLYAGPAERGMDICQPLRELGTPLIDGSSVDRYKVFQSTLDAVLATKGTHAYMKSVSTELLSDAAIDLLCRQGAELPTPLTAIGIRHLGGAISLVPENGTAYGNRDAAFNISYDAISFDASDAERLVEWGRASAAEMQQLTGGGAYLNFVGTEEDNTPELVKSAYRANWDRLVEVKRRYDPDNLFRGHNNIQP